jgi:putative hydrolases of HD superfamily
MTDSGLQDLVKLLEISGALKRTKRTGWVDIGVNQPESVADHTFRTAFLCMIYAELENLDTLKLLRMALIHDLPEAIIGDLMPKQKNSETKQKEESAISDILSLLPEVQRESFLAVWKEYKEGESKEAKALKQLDKVEMALQATEYKKLGTQSKSLERFFNSAKSEVSWPELKRLLSCILEEK